MKKLFPLWVLFMLLIGVHCWAATDYTADGNCQVAYTFEESSGNADDKCSGGTNDGTVGSGITYSQTGKYGNAYDYDNTVNSYVDINDVQEIDDASAITVAAWIFVDNDSDHYVSAKSNGITDGFSFFRDDVASVSGRTNTITMFVADSADTSNARYEGATNAAPINTWVHVCSIVNLTAATIDMFVDGSQSVSQVTSIGITAIDGGTNDLTVGSNSAKAANWSGKIDEYIILDTAKVESDCDSIMDNGIDGSQAAGGDRRFLTLKVPERKRVKYLLAKGYSEDEAFEIIKRDPALLLSSY